MATVESLSTDDIGSRVGAMEIPQPDTTAKEERRNATQRAQLANQHVLSELQADLQHERRRYNARMARISH